MDILFHTENRIMIRYISYWIYYKMRYVLLCEREQMFLIFYIFLLHGVFARHVRERLYEIMSYCIFYKFYYYHRVYILHGMMQTVTIC